MGESSHFHLALSGPPANLTVTLSLRRPALFINLCRIPQPRPGELPQPRFSLITKLLAHFIFSSSSFFFFFFFLSKNTSLDSLELRTLRSRRGAHPAALSHRINLFAERRKTSSPNGVCVYVGVCVCVCERERETGRKRICLSFKTYLSLFFL